MSCVRAPSPSSFLGASVAFYVFSLGATNLPIPRRRYDTFKEMILSTGLIGDGIGLYFASSFMAVSFISV